MAQLGLRKKIIITLMLDGGKEFKQQQLRASPKGNQQHGDGQNRQGRESALVTSTAGPDHRNIFHFVEQHALPFKEVC